MTPRADAHPVRPPLALRARQLRRARRHGRGHTRAPTGRGRPAGAFVGGQPRAVASRRRAPRDFSRTIFLVGDKSGPGTLFPWQPHMFYNDGLSPFVPLRSPVAEVVQIFLQVAPPSGDAGGTAGCDPPTCEGQWAAACSRRVAGRSPTVTANNRRRDEAAAERSPAGTSGRTAHRSPHPRAAPPTCMSGSQTPSAARRLSPSRHTRPAVRRGANAGWWIQAVRSPRNRAEGEGLHERHGPGPRRPDAG